MRKLSAASSWPPCYRYPVAMKIVSPDIIHKSDVGGVKLHLDAPQGVRDAFDLMMLRVCQRFREARLEAV